MTTVSSTFSSPSPSADPAAGRRPGRASYYRRRGTNAPNRPLVHCQGHQPSTGGYGLRVMPAAPSREPSARRAWSIRSAKPSWAGARSLAARTWSGHRLFIIVLTPGRSAPRRRRARLPVAGLVQRLVRVCGEHGPLPLDPTRMSGYSIWLKFLQPFHSYALVTILQHLMGLAVARNDLRAGQAPLRSAALASHAGGRARALRRVRDRARAPDHGRRAVPVPAYPGGHAAAVGSRGPSLRRCAVIGGLLGIGAVLRSIGTPLLAVFAVYMIIRRFSWRKVAATIVVCLIPVVGYAAVFDLEHGQFASPTAPACSSTHG